MEKYFLIRYYCQYRVCFLCLHIIFVRMDALLLHLPTLASFSHRFDVKLTKLSCLWQILC